jgi:hypothetical protein
MMIELVLADAGVPMIFIEMPAIAKYYGGIDKILP